MDCPKCHSLNPDASRFCGNCAAPLDPNTPDPASFTKTIAAPFSILPAGTIVAGKYRILELIGRGGMGLVYKAEDLRLHRTVALKFLPAEIMNEPRARNRFILEARAASALDNPHICTIHEIDETEDGRMYINMSCYDGESLKERIERGPLEPDKAISIATQVAQGLAAAHKKGIIHRDIKPGNIFLTDDGIAKILDFGLAMLAGEVRLTRPGHAVGTVAYISPEQLKGEKIDSRADIWSLGIVLFEMLTEKLPFSGDSEQAFAYAIVTKEPQIEGNLPENTPPGLIRIIRRALTKNPEKRYSSAAEMADALATLASGTALPPVSGVTRFVEKIERIIRARKTLFAAIPVLAVAALLVFLLLPERGRRVAFMPLMAVGNDEAHGVFIDGLSEFLSRNLAGIVNRHRRSWVFPINEIQDNEVREAADAERILGADITVSGTARRSGDQVALNLEVVEPRRLRRLATLSKTDNIANIATWQKDVIIEIAEAVGIKVTQTESEGLAAGGTTVPAAFGSYVQGLGHLARAETVEEVETAVAALREALDGDPSFIAAGIDLASAYLKQYEMASDASRAAVAESLCREILSRHEDSVEAHVMLGTILRSLNKSGEAVREFELAQKINPRCFEAQLGIGLACDDAARPGEAEAAYRAALRLRPGYWYANAKLGYFFIMRGDFEKARDFFLEVTKISPGHVEGLNNLGAAYVMLGDERQAEAAFVKSNAVRRNADACSNLAYLYYFRGRYADAVFMNEAAIGFNPDFYVHWGNLADSYFFTPGNEAKAMEAYRRAIELAEKELAVNPGDPRVSSSLAIFLAKSGFAEKAKASIENALRSRPDDGPIVFKAILVYELGGDRAKALEALRTLVAMKGPMDEVIKEPFLSSLREDPRYVEAMGGAREAKSGLAGK